MSSVLSALKNATQHLHDQLEQVSYTQELRSGTLTIHEYELLILTNYLIYSELEPLLNQQLQDLPPSFQTFTSDRLTDLKKDLRYFSDTEMTLPLLLEFDLKLSCPASLIGMLYVLEGARLGGKVILKKLSNNPQLRVVPAFHFYAQSGIDTRSRWIHFSQIATKHLQSEKEVQLAQMTAQGVFDYFYSVFFSRRTRLNGLDQCKAQH